VNFDRAIISLASLSEVHLRTHSASGTYSPGGRYRSAIYVLEADQHSEAARTVAQFAKESNATARTMALPLLGFKSSDARYQNYYRTKPDRPFCRRYINPKLKYIRDRYAEITLTALADGKSQVVTS
jgi:peptide-methionine (S)-S-oxide reductase